MADHKRGRRHLARWYGPRNIDSTLPRMQQLLDHHVDELTRARSSADLISQLVRPFVTRFVLEFAGIPEEDWDEFQSWTYESQVRRPTPAPVGPSTSNRYLRSVLDRKRRRPGSDALSAAVQSAVAADEDTDTALDEIGTFGLAHYDVLANRLGYGLLFLLRHRQQLQLLLRDCSLASSAVEEILRMAVPGSSWIPRYALADIDYPAAPIRAGELVVFAMQSANQDDEVFTDAGRFDIMRTPNRHLAFGYGKFYCLGAHLSRALLRVALDRIFQRLPRLRLSVSPETIYLNDHLVTGGLRSLPVAWD